MHREPGVPRDPAIFVNLLRCNVPMAQGFIQLGVISAAVCSTVEVALPSGPRSLHSKQLFEAAPDADVGVRHHSILCAGMGEGAFSRMQ